MACQISYNTEGKIVRVNTPTGEESTLFNQIAKLPQVKNQEEALALYQNKYKGEYQGETPLTFISDKENTFNSYKEALKDSDEGDIKIFSGDTPIQTVSANTNKNTTEGLINSLIKEDILSDEKIIDQGESFHKAEGTNTIKQMVNENIIKKSKANTKVTKDGRITFTEDRNRKSDVVYDLVRQVLNRTSGAKQAKLSEDALKNRLLDFLKEIGVTVTTIENYNKKYSSNSSAKALADISNQIVAFREGRIDLDSLTEETAHFIVEAWNEQDIEGLLRNIHKTEAYQEHSDYYREIYSKENSSEEVENLVRKEILGKELAKALQNRFTTESTPQNILNRLYELLIKFFDTIVLKDDYNVKLDSLSERVQDMLLTNNISNYLDTSNFQNKKFKLYSVSPNPQQNLIRSLQEQEKVLIKLGRGSQEQLHKLQGYLSQAMEKSTVRDLITLSRRQTSYIREAIKDANSRGTTLSVEENIVFQNLKNIISPAISTLKNAIEKDKNYTFEVIDIRSVQEDINDAIGAVQNSENGIIDSIVESALERANRQDDDELREELKNAIVTAKKDTNSLYSYFGQITHAQDPLLNMLGSVIGDIYQDTSEEFQDASKTFQKAIRDLGFNEKSFKDLIQEDGYIISKWDFEEFKEFDRYAKAQAYKNNLEEIIADGNSVEEHKAFLNLSDKEFLDKFKEIPLITNFQLFQKVKTEAQRIKNTGSETFLSEKYVKEQEEKLVGYSEATKTVLRNISQLRGQVKRQMKKSKNGVNILTRQGKIDLDMIASERARHMNIYNEDGNPKTGITVSDSEGIKISEREYISLDYSIATEEALVAFELHKYNSEFIEGVKKTGGFLEGLSDLWRKDLTDMENDSEISREDIVSWFNLNTSVGFSNAFFENSESVNIFDKYQYDEVVSEDIENYRNLTIKRRNLLKQYKDSKNFVNTNVQAMPEAVKNNIKELSEEIDRVSSKVFMYIKGKEKGSEIEERNAKTSANEAYFGELKDLNLNTVEEQLEFTKKHMTVSNKVKVDAMLNAIENDTLTEKMKLTLAPYGVNKQGVLEFAQTKLLPYYASYAPLDLQNFYKQVRETNTPVSELVKSLESSEDVRIAVSYEYMDNQSSNDILNPLRDKDFKGGVAQPSLIKKPELFGRKFDFNNKNWEKINKNAKLKKLHDLTVEFQANSLKDADHEQGNAYLMPQVPKTILENIEMSAKGKLKSATKEALQSIQNYRVGDIAEGEKDENGNPLAGSHIRVIPKYFVYELENKSNVSTDLFFSMMSMRQQAILRKNRVNNYSKISTIMDAITDSTRYAGIGKQAEATNTYKMAKSYIDNAIFGIEDVARARVDLPIVGQTDFTKIIKVIHRWKQNLSLSFNPIVPMTSYVTASTGMFGERLIGQYMDSDSMNRANKTFAKKFTESGVGDALQVYSKGEASVILEHLGLLDLSNRFKNSKYEKVGRLIGDSAYGLHQMADFPIKGNVAYALLYGHRIFNERLIDKNAFNRLSKGKTKSEIDIAWKELTPLYDFVEVKDGKFNYKDSLYAQLKTDEQSFKNIEKGLISKGKALAQRVDGTLREEERTFAQRHFALRYTMTHKGWLALAVSNRFKGRHFNLQTSQWEEGTYSSAGKLTGRLIEYLFKKDLKLNDFWKNASQEEKINMQRILKELVVLGGVYALGLMFAGFADDDDSDYLNEVSAYLFERVTNETISSQAGIVKEIYNSTKEPLVGLSQLTELSQFYKLASGDETVEKGRYQGLTERQRWVIKNVVGIKPIYDLWDADNLKAQRDSYNYFNNGNDDFNPFAWIISKDEYLEE